MAVETRPKGPRTGHSHPGCYARALADCSDKISREHYVSEKLLRRIGGDAVAVNGMVWHPDWLSLPIANAAVANILCERHNSALSSLDDAITDLYDVLEAWRAGRTFGERFVDGNDVERWAIKLMLGFASSGAAGIGGRKARARSIPHPYLCVLFGEEKVPDGGGFHYTGDLPHLPRSDAKLAFWTMHLNGEIAKRSTATVVGIAVRMLGFAFVTTVAAVPADPGAYRPGTFIFDELGVLRFTWAARTGGTIVLRPDGSASILLETEGTQ